MAKEIGSSNLDTPGFGGKGFFGKRPKPPGGAPPANFTFTAGGPASNGPWDPLAAGFPYGTSADFGSYQDGNTSQGTALGAISGGSLIGGKQVSSIGFTGDVGTGAWVVVLNSGGTIAQSFFTSVHAVDAVSGLNLTLATAAANYFNSNDAVHGFVGYTVWAWTQVPILIAGDIVTVSTT